MQDRKEYRICTDCKIHHYENCETCFGFGLTLYNIPITAAEAMGYEKLPEWKLCPECGSTPKGIPNMSKVNQEFIKYLEKLLVKAKNGNVHFDSMDVAEQYNPISLDEVTLRYIPKGYSLVKLVYYEEDDE